MSEIKEGQWLDLDRRIEDEIDNERAVYCAHLCQVREKKEGMNMDYAKAWNKLKALYEWKVETVKDVEDRSSWDKMVTLHDEHVLTEIKRIEDNPEVNDGIESILKVKVLYAKFENEEMCVDEFLSKISNLIDGIY